MKNLTMKALAAKSALLFALTSPGAMALAQAGIPVIDSANLTQTVMSAVENVAQTLKQIEQYRTQLQQYENMLQNTAAPSAYIWDQAQATMSQLRQAINTLDYYKRQMGSLDGYLAKFQDVSYYRSSPCFNMGCTKSEWDAMAKNSAKLGSEAQKKANDAMFKGLDQQQDAMENDARQLGRLQSSAQGATGQMQAIGFANQLASNQANQLLQIRALLIAQQNAAITRQQVLADQEAKQQATHEASTETRIDQTATPKNWLELTR
jgi:P-type conjugative transfer protein TrbJ